MTEQQKMIKRNANLAFDRFVKMEQARGQEANKSSVARTMARVLGKNFGSMRRTMDLLLEGPQRWTPDYMRAFALATETPYNALFLPSYAGESIPKSHYDAYMIEVVKTLTHNQQQSIVGLIRDDEYHPGTLELLFQIHAAIRSATTREQARDDVDALLRKASMWRERY